MSEVLFTSKEFCEKTGISERTLKRAVASGKVNPTKINSRKYGYTQKDIDDFNKSYKPKTNEDKLEDIKKELKNHYGYDPYTFLGEYVNTDHPISVKCNKCDYEFKITPGNIKNNIRKNKKPTCKQCNFKTKQVPINKKKIERVVLENYDPNRNTQLEVTEYIKSIINDREILENYKEEKTELEFGIYIPELKIGIDCYDSYAHSEKFVGKKYHINKCKLAESEGIKCIQIWDLEWIFNKDVIKSKLAHLSSSNNHTKVFARKCTIREINPNVKNDFLNRNHIQGKDQAKIKLGMFYNHNGEETLVAVMTFCKPRVSLNSSTDFDYELSRFATERDFRVIGGFSKMLKYFERNYEWSKILTFADRRFSQGNVYLNNGFTLLRNSEPNYYYINKNTKEKFHRFTFRKQVLQEKFPDIYDPELTEYQIMDNTDYYRIHDCGNMVFEYTKEK